MSNDNRGNFSDDDTNGVDRTVDPTIDFGDEFGGFGLVDVLFAGA